MQLSMLFYDCPRLGILSIFHLKRKAPSRTKEGEEHETKFFSYTKSNVLTVFSSKYIQAPAVVVMLVVLIYLPV
jgi:hypothetical protein